MEIILDAFSHSFQQFLSLFGLLLLGGLTLTLISRWTSRTFESFIYPKFGLYVFGWIGVPFHEFSHAVFCKIFGHEIENVKWFDPRAKGGAVGAVTHSYDNHNPYHRVGHFFIGLGPTLLAPVALALLFCWLVPGARSFQPFVTNSLQGEILAFSHALFRAVNFTSLGFYCFLYLAICISSQVELSREDLNQVKIGILPILLILFFVNLIACTFNWDWHRHIVNWGSKIMIFSGCLFALAVAIAMINLAICYLLFSLLNFTKRKA